MPLAAKIVLLCPVADESRLAAFVEECLQDRVLLVAAVGPGSRRIETLIDNLIIDDGTDRDRFFSTSSHPYQPLSEVLEFASFWLSDDAVEVQQIRLKVGVYGRGQLNRRSVRNSRKRRH